MNTAIKASYTASDDAKRDLIGLGFIRYISSIDGAEMFTKDGPGWRREVARIKHHWVAPLWGDSKNHFTVEFI
jgi:hypothetical protein